MELIDGYPAKMRESIENVERTRDQRLGQVFKSMTLEERAEVLENFHPDFIKTAKRAIGVGPNTGDMVPHEVADLLEAYPHIDPDDIDLGEVDLETDLLVVGGGGAGTVAALWAHYNGVPMENITMITKLRHGDSNSIMAQGGIQAADRPNDSPAIHYLDVLGGGHFSNVPELARALVEDGPSIIKWHEELGVMYDKRADGSMITAHGGGTSRMRMHSAKDYTGLEILRVVRDEARNLGMKVLEFNTAVELLLDEKGAVGGVLAMNLETERYQVIKARSTVIATGGFGRLHMQGFPTTNHYGATADGLVMAYRAGAKLMDMDSVQYHPTGAAYPDQIVGLLITEKVRGLGAQPVNIDGEQFVYPLEPRDVESAGFIRECTGVCRGISTPTGMTGVWLDSPMIDLIRGEGTIERDLSAMYRMYKRFGIDIRKDPILVYPTLHYQNGGVAIDAEARVLNAAGKPIPGLFAGGEVCGGIHGKNRLMGNSLLDYNVFGRRAGISAAAHLKKARTGKLSLAHVSNYLKALEKARIKTDRRSPMILPDYRDKKSLARTLDLM